MTLTATHALLAALALWYLLRCLQRTWFNALVLLLIGYLAWRLDLPITASALPWALATWYLPRRFRARLGLLSTYLHEAGHAVVALARGADLVALEVTPQGGRCVTRQRSLSVVQAAAGYLGLVAYAGLLLVAPARPAFGPPLALGLTALTLLPALLLWPRLKARPRWVALGLATGVWACLLAESRLALALIQTAGLVLLALGWRDLVLLMPQSWRRDLATDAHHVAQQWQLPPPLVSLLGLAIGAAYGGACLWLVVQDLNLAW